MTISVILFDFDGVLVDTPALHHQAFNESLRQHGLARVYWFGTGETTKQKLKKFYPDKEEMYHSILLKKEEIYEEIFKNVLKNLKCNILKHFKNYKVGIVSNSKRRYIDQYLTECGVSRDDLSVIISIEDVENRKPDPESYRKAIERLGINPKEALVIEDSAEGIQSALEAGCNVFECDYIKLDEEVIKQYIQGNFNE